MELIVKRYERRGDTIHSMVKLKCKDVVYDMQGIERAGFEMEEGIYKGRWSYSPKFRRDLYIVEGTKRTGIRIHAGNSKDDVRGCLIVGVYRKGLKILKSKQALRQFHALSEQSELNILVYEENNPEHFEQGVSEIFRNLVECIRKNVKR